jgi:putative salt-induced outer membrane protein
MWPGSLKQNEVENTRHQIGKKFSVAPRFMRTSKSLLVAVGILAAFLFTASAQTNVLTVTNYVAVVVTNVVTVTNVVAGVPARGRRLKTVPVPAALIKHPWQSSISAGLTLTRGNSHTLLYQGDFLTEKKTPKNEFTLGVGGAYGSQDSKDNVNNYHASGQWNHLFTEKLYDYVRADAQRDVIADLDYRFNIGPGVGYYLIKQTNTSLTVETGVGYQNEHLGGDYNSFATLRLAERFEHKFDGHARLWQNVELLPQADRLENYGVNFEIGLETPIIRTLSLKTCFDDTYASQPAAGRQKNDAKIVAGIAYKF